MDRAGRVGQKGEGVLNLHGACAKIKTIYLLKFAEEDWAMSGWLLIWVLFAAGFVPLGCGIYFLLNRTLRAERAQRRAGIAFIAVGLAMMFPVLWALVPLLLRGIRFA